MESARTSQASGKKAGLKFCASVGDAVLELTFLLRNYSAEPRLESEILLGYSLGLDRTGLFLNWNRRLKPNHYEKARRLLRKRISGIPLAYVLGKWSFFGMEFYVDNRVLIPRPETEFLVTSVIDWCKERKGFGTLKITDVGTGSGAVAIALAKKIPGSVTYATDISRDALNVACKNIKLHGVENVRLLHGDLLNQIPEELDVVVANLPYVPTGKIGRLRAEISEHEPRAAIDGGADGFSVYRRLFLSLGNKVKKEGFLAIEIDESHGILARNSIASFFPKAKIGVENDLNGLTRYAFARLE